MLLILQENKLSVRLIQQNYELLVNGDSPAVNHMAETH